MPVACKHLILRTSWVYAARGGNFARTMLRLAAEREQLSVIDDQHGAPTGAELLADLTAHMLRSVHAQPALGGTYHAVASGETSWYGYARHVIEFARSAGQAVTRQAAGHHARAHQCLPDAGKAPAQFAAGHAQAATQLRPGTARLAHRRRSHAA